MLLWSNPPRHQPGRVHGHSSDNKLSFRSSTTAVVACKTTTILIGTYDWGGTDDGVCISTHALRGLRGHAPSEKKCKIRCSEIASGTIFVLKFIFGPDAARIPGPSVFGAPLAMFRDR